MGCFSDGCILDLCSDFRDNVQANRPFHCPGTQAGLSGCWVFLVRLSLPKTWQTATDCDYKAGNIHLVETKLWELATHQPGKWTSRFQTSDSVPQLWGSPPREDISAATSTSTFPHGPFLMLNSVPSRLLSSENPAVLGVAFPRKVPPASPFIQVHNSIFKPLASSPGRAQLSPQPRPLMEWIHSLPCPPHPPGPVVLQM